MKSIKLALANILVIQVAVFVLILSTQSDLVHCRKSYLSNKDITYLLMMAQALKDNKKFIPVPIFMTPFILHKIKKFKNRHTEYYLIKDDDIKPRTLVYKYMKVNGGPKSLYVR